MKDSLSSEFVELDDLKIPYLSAGEGEVILLLHGWLTFAYLWRNIIPALAQNYQVTYLPGFGLSDKRQSDSFSFRFYQQGLDGFLKAIGVEPGEVY